IGAVLALGAEGVQIGTAFLACDESGASPAHRAALLSGSAGQTTLTRGFTGRLARGIKNQLMDAMNAADVEVLPYPLQRYLMRNVATLAEKLGRPELTPMWSGQSASLLHHSSAATLMDALVSSVASSQKS